MMNAQPQSLSALGPAGHRRWFLALTAAIIGLAVSASVPARAATPSEPINTVTPISGPNISVPCGTECLTCCNCCTPGMPQQFLTMAYQQHRNTFILGSFWNGTAQQQFRTWATQLSQAWLFQTRMIGGFYDAQNSSRAQLEIQKLHAEALRDYMPSEAVCQFGTLSRSLHSSEEKSRSNQLLLSTINLSRNLGTYANVGASGRGQDGWDRMDVFIRSFCNVGDNDNALVVFCEGGVGDQRLNRDIDYARTLAVPETLRVDFTNNTVSTPENDLIMLGHNLYGHKQFIRRIDEYDMGSGTGQNLQQLMRSVEAKRALAENSFNVYAASKAQGSGASYSYMDTVMRNLGLTNAADRDAYFGTITPPGGPTPAGTPSYYAQMDILTKRIYQNPGFYAQLMDKRANISRQQASMEGLELMQDRDIFTSMSRSEQLLALLVEMEAIKLQSKVQNNVTGQ